MVAMTSSSRQSSMQPIGSKARASHDPSDLAELARAGRAAASPRAFVGARFADPPVQTHFGDSQMKIRDVMTRNVHACSADEPLSHAAAIMWQFDCGCVPVVDAEHRVIGLVTDRDLAMAAYFENRRLEEIPVATAMSREVVSCSPLDTPETAELTMQQRRIRRLPVIDDQGILVGIVSLADIAYQMAHAQTFGGDGMSWICIGRTLATICEPRPRESESGG
jgi:CBS domain-containing protein